MIQFLAEVQITSPSVNERLRSVYWGMRTFVGDCQKWGDWGVVGDESREGRPVELATDDTCRNGPQAAL